MSSSLLFSLQSVVAPNVDSPAWLEVLPGHLLGLSSVVATHWKTKFPPQDTFQSVPTPVAEFGRVWYRWFSESTTTGTVHPATRANPGFHNIRSRLREAEAPDRAVRGGTAQVGEATCIGFA